MTDFSSIAFWIALLKGEIWSGYLTRFPYTGRSGASSSYICSSTYLTGHVNRSFQSNRKLRAFWHVNWHVTWYIHSTFRLYAYWHAGFDASFEPLACHSRNHQVFLWKICQQVVHSQHVFELLCSISENAETLRLKPSDAKTFINNLLVPIC